MLRIFCWCLILWLYWAVVVHFLRSASPVFIDEGGPMPSFQWGHLPQPNYGEYLRRKHYYVRIYSLPYYFAGLLLTTLGCGAAFLVVRKARPSLSRVFWRAAGGTLTAVILVALASDVGTRLGAWRGPMFLLHSSYWDPANIWALCKMFLPACAMSGVVAIGKHCSG